MPKSRRASLNVPGFNMNKILTAVMSAHRDHDVLELSEIDTKHLDISNPDDFCTEEMHERYRSLL
eukprot:12887486-Prorocentrum_lima.AAC.1